MVPTTTVSVAVLSLSQLNTKGFSKPDVRKLQKYILTAIKDSHNQLVTHLYTNGVYIPYCNDYMKNIIMGVSWSKAYIESEVHVNRTLISKMINMFLLKDMVISHMLGLRNFIVTSVTDRYQVLYNILVKHHPNLTTKYKVQNIYPAQAENNSFAFHVKQVKQYISAERSPGRDYTDQEVLALTIRTLRQIQDGFF